jgi:hypothetical protein
MRDNHGFNITARWIDIPDVLTSPDDEFDYETTDFSYLDNLWDKGCKIDSTIGCDMTALFARPEDGEKHSGSLVELGHTTASYVYTGVQKPVYLIGSCQSFEKVGHSDRAFTHQRTFHAIDTQDMLEGFELAVEHYQNNYAKDWLLWRAFVKKNEFIRRTRDYCNEKNYIEKTG